MTEHPMPGKRINIRGTSGSGKSTLGKNLAEAIGVPFVELDAFNHLPGWTERPHDDFNRLVVQATSAAGWVVDGNYARAGEFVMARADTIVWLDYRLPTILLRLTRRTFGRWYRHELLWGTNFESLWRHFLVPKDSLYWWVLTTYKRRRRQADDLFAESHPHIVKIRFYSPKEADRWLERVRSEYSKFR